MQQLCYLIFLSGVLSCCKGSLLGKVNPVIAALEQRSIKVDRPCDLVTDISNISEVSDLRMRVNFGNSNGTIPERSRISKFLFRNSRCVIGVTISKPGLSMSSITTLTEAVPDNVWIIIGKDKSEITDLDQTVHSFVYMEQQRDRDSYTVNVFCPNTTDSPWTKVLDVVKNGQLTLDIVNFNFLAECPHPLNNKNVSVGYRNAMPSIWVDAKTKEMGGIDILLTNAIADKFKFKPAYRQVQFEQYNQTANRYNTESAIGQLEINGIHIGIGYQTQNANDRQFCDYTALIDYANFVWWTRGPVPLTNYRNITRPFSSLVWATMAGSLGLFAISFYIMFIVYEKLEIDGLAVNLVHPIDFIIFTFCRFVEPEPIPWFPRWSAGRFLVGVWSVATMILVLSYSGNLRANLIAKEYEKPIKTHQDVLDRGTTPYLTYAFNLVRHDIAIRYGIKLPNDIIALSKRAYERNSYYRMIPSYLPKDAIEDVLDNGASFLGVDSSIMYTFLFDQRLGLPNLIKSDEAALTLPISLKVKKYIPWRRDFDRAIYGMVEMGLIQHYKEKPLPIRATQVYSRKKNLESLKPLELSHILTTCMFLAFMLIVSSLGFCLERQFRSKTTKVWDSHYYMKRGKRSMNMY